MILIWQLQDLSQQYLLHSKDFNIMSTNEEEDNRQKNFASKRKVLAVSIYFLYKRFYFLYKK